MQFSGQNNGGTSNLAFMLARKCDQLTKTCIMNMQHVHARIQDSDSITKIAERLLSDPIPLQGVTSYPDM